MKIGITGAYGFLGANLVAHALKNEAASSLSEIRAFYRKTQANPLFDSTKVKPYKLDTLDQGAIARAFEGLDAVFHFAGMVDYRSRGKRATWDANVLGTNNVLIGAAKAGVRRLVLVSSINVFGNRAPGGGLVDETGSPFAEGRANLACFASRDEALEAVRASLKGDYRFLKKSRVTYFDSKLAALAWAREFCSSANSGMALPELVAVMPGTAVGPGELRDDISALVGMVFANKMRFSLSGSTSFVDSRDCARAIWLAFLKGRAGESYVVSGKDEDNLSYSGFMRACANVARAQGRRCSLRFFAMPRAIALPVASIAEAIAPKGKLTKALVLSGSARQGFTSMKAKRELGYEPKYDLGESILDCANWRGKA